jgi:hypothetical protein
MVLYTLWAHSSLRVGIEQEQLAIGDPVSGSRTAEPLFQSRGDTEKLMAKLSVAEAAVPG